MTTQAESPRTTKTPETPESETREAKPSAPFKLRSGLRAGYVWA